MEGTKENGKRVIENGKCRELEFFAFHCQFFIYKDAVAFTILGIVDVGADRSRAGAFFCLADGEHFGGRHRHGENSGALFQLASRTRFSSEQPLADTLGRGNFEKFPRPCFDHRRNHFVVAGRAGAGNSDDSVGIDNARYTGKTPARSANHQAANDSGGSQQPARPLPETASDFRLKWES